MNNTLKTIIKLIGWLCMAIAGGYGGSQLPL